MTVQVNPHVADRLAPAYLARVQVLRTAPCSTSQQGGHSAWPRSPALAELHSTRRPTMREPARRVIRLRMSGNTPILEAITWQIFVARYRVTMGSTQMAQELWTWPSPPSASSSSRLTPDT